MKLTNSYVIGELELIAMKNGLIAVRMVNCGPKINDYEGQRVTKRFPKKIYGEFAINELTLSHPLMSFAEGDKVKLTRHFDGEKSKFTLKNLTLSSSELGGLDDLKPKAGEKYFSINVRGTLQYLGMDQKTVFIRINCVERTYVSFDAKSEKKENFDKEIFVGIPKAKINPDVEARILAVYKKGDKVQLSYMCQDDTSLDLDNLTLSRFNAQSTLCYHSAWEL